MQPTKTSSVQKAKLYLRKTVFCLVGLFILLFTIRFSYGFFKSEESGISNSDESSSFNFGRRNYAGYRKYKSEENYFKEAYKDKPSNIPPEETGSIASEQKYERIATINNTTRAYDSDEKKLYQVIQSHNALVQYEMKDGLVGDRRLNLAIGVQPEKFDAMVVSLKSIGKLNALTVNKIDKTTEYRELNAQKISIIKSRNSLVELKKNQGSLADFVALEEKILEMEKKIQDMGVELGSFDSENEFCTVKISLFEGSSPNKIPILHRIKVALYWSMEMYFSIVGLTVFTFGLGWLGIVFTFGILNAWVKHENKD